jgi:signal transduction histidine kinase
VEHPDVLSILLEDDGVGIDQRAVATGRGLDTIRRKIAYLKGRIEIGSKEEKGTLIMIEIPVINKHKRTDGHENTYSG